MAGLACSDWLGGSPFSGHVRTDFPPYTVQKSRNVKNCRFRHFKGDHRFMIWLIPNAHIKYVRGKGADARANKDLECQQLIV